MVSVYKSWVPTVIARLSFSEIGHTLHPTRCVRANEGDRTSRYVVAYQKRVTIDAIIPLKEMTSRIFSGLEGEMWFACIAKTESHDSRDMEKLTGHLYMFHDHKLWESVGEKPVRCAQNSLRNIAKNFPQESISSFEPEYKALNDELRNSTSFHIDFSLLRCGEVTMKFDPEEPRHNDAPYFGDPEDQNLVHIVASQVFFFLKDICHNHQHHRPRTDTVIDLHDFVSERYWREQVLYSLYRKIIQYKRHRTYRTISDSQGVLAYASAFEKLSKRALEEHSSKEKLPTFESDSLRESLESASNNVTWDMQRKSWKSDRALNFIVGTLGVALAVTGVLSLTGENYPVNSDLIKLATLLLEYPYVLVVGLIALYAMLAQIEDRKIIRNIIRLIQPYKKDYVTAAFFLVSGGALIYIISSDLFMSFVNGLLSSW